MVEGLQADADVMELERHFIAAVPPQGSIGNGALRIKLGWREDLYWQIRTRLLAAGILVKGRGRGGSVLRTAGTPQYRRQMDASGCYDRRLQYVQVRARYPARIGHV